MYGLVSSAPVQVAAGAQSVGVSLLKTIVDVMKIMEDVGILKIQCRTVYKKVFRRKRSSDNHLINSRLRGSRIPV